MKKQNQNLIFIIISVVIILLIYFIITIVRFFKQPADTVLIKNGELIKYEEAIGYIIRDEEIVDTSSYTGTPKANVDDAVRVAKGTEILTYMSKEEEQINEKIKELDVKIQKAMDSRQTIFSNDAKALESEIELYLYSTVKENTDINSLFEYKNLINEKIEKKAKIVGELSPVGSELKKLIDQRTSLEKELNDSEKTIKSKKSGLVSYRVDNYENVLTTDSLSKPTKEELEKINITTNQIIPLNINKVKIINNFECYIAVSMNSDESKNANLNDSVYLRFDNTGDKLISATVEYISEEESGRLIVFRINTNVEELTKYRKIDVDVVWWSDKGLKVNKDALEDTTIQNASGDALELSKITIKKSSYTEEALVKIVREAGEFAIIDNYTDKELLNMGIDENILNNRSTIKMYDEVIVPVENKSK